MGGPRSRHIPLFLFLFFSVWFSFPLGLPLTSSDSLSLEEHKDSEADFQIHPLEKLALVQSISNPDTFRQARYIRGNGDHTERA